MNMNVKTIGFITTLTLVVIYASGSGIWVNSSPGWYSALNRPTWQPPDFIFGIIWPYNFLVIGIASYFVTQHASQKTMVLWNSLFAISVCSALVWAQQFYVPHNLVIAAVALTLTALITIPLTVIAYQQSLGIGLLFTPYQIWIATAAALSISYASKN